MNSLIQPFAKNIIRQHPLECPKYAPRFGKTIKRKIAAKYMKPTLSFTFSQNYTTGGKNLLTPACKHPIGHYIKTNHMFEACSYLVGNDEKKTEEYFHKFFTEKDARKFLIKKGAELLFEHDLVK